MRNSGRTHNLGRLSSIFLGPAVTVVAIVFAHAEAIMVRTDDYVAAPPTISRLLVHPDIAGPFAVAMIVSAIFLAIAIVQIISAMMQIIRMVGVHVQARQSLLLLILFCELVAVAGMIVLSQFTGDLHDKLHLTGSYMLFFGHSVGIGLAGLMMANIMKGKTSLARTSLAPRQLDVLARAPRRAAWVALLSVAYGIVFFSRAFVEDKYFFWQRAVQGLLEVVVIFSFLYFLVMLFPLLAKRP